MDEHGLRAPGVSRKAAFLLLRSLLILAASALVIGTAGAAIPLLQGLAIVVLLASAYPLATMTPTPLPRSVAVAVAVVDVAWMGWAVHASGVLSAGAVLPWVLIAALVLYGRTLVAPEPPRRVAADAPVGVDTAIATAVAGRTRELERRYQESVAANQAKTEFVANMSHELRTPLNIIIGYTDMLRDESSSPDAAESDRLMGRIRTAASNLLHLVDMVLDLGKLDAGKIPVRSTSLALETFVEELAQRERIRLAPGVVFRCDADSDLPTIETDPTKLTMILDNLISNAIKFTRAGSIAVRVTHLRDQQCVQFEVEDTGPGIEPGHLETIFEPFHQLERSSDNPFGGFGLGLAIVHRHVGLLGGAIAVRSTVDVGTCFTLTLPYRPGAASARDVGVRRAVVASAAADSALSVQSRAASAEPL